MDFALATSKSDHGGNRRATLVDNVRSEDFLVRLVFEAMTDDSLLADPMVQRLDDRRRTADCPADNPAPHGNHARCLWVNRIRVSGSESPLKSMGS